MLKVHAKSAGYEVIDEFGIDNASIVWLTLNENNEVVEVIDEFDIDIINIVTVNQIHEMPPVKTYIIDYKTPDGFKNFITVDALDRDSAIKLFRKAGRDGWTGYNYSEYQIIDVTER